MEKYLSYLRAKMRDKAHFVITEDLYEHPEHIVAQKDEIIDKDKYRSLSQLNLHKPLVSIIRVADILDNDAISQALNKLVTNDSSLNEIDKHFGNASIMSQCCKRLQTYPDLLEILTILKIEINDLFEQSLFSAYLAYILGIVSKQSQIDIETAFLAGLLHDIGLLFMPKSHQDKTKKLTAKEWKDIQLHPIIAFKLLKNIDDFPIIIRKAILDHHERPDGSGYPLRKKENDINELGSLISLLDDVILIYNKRFKPLKRSIKNVLPVIQMNAFGYHHSPLSTITTILKNLSSPKIENIDKNVVKDLIDYTYQQQLYINQIIDAVKQVNNIIGFEHNNKSIAIIQSMGGKISSLIFSVELRESSYIELLQRLNTENHQELHIEVEETRLMLEEVIYQLHNYHKATNSFYTKHSNELSEKINIFNKLFSSTKNPSVPESISNYWKKLSPK